MANININQAAPGHVLGVLADGQVWTTDNVCRASLLAASTVPGVLGALLAAGLVERPVRGRYRITDAGRAHLAGLSE